MRFVSWLALAVALISMIATVTMQLTGTEVAIALIALAALATSLWQAYLSRRHAAASVRPWLTLEWDVNSGLLAVTNAGPGPALVKSMMIGTPGVPLDVATDQHWREVFDNTRETLGWCQGSRMTIDTGTLIAPGGTMNILQFENFGTRDLEAVFNWLHVFIGYESLYGETDNVWCNFNPT